MPCLGSIAMRSVPVAPYRGNFSRSKLSSTPTPDPQAVRTIETVNSLCISYSGITGEGVCQSAGRAMNTLKDDTVMVIRCRPTEKAALPAPPPTVQPLLSALRCRSLTVCTTCTTPAASTWAPAAFRSSCTPPTPSLPEGCSQSSGTRSSWCVINPGCVAIPNAMPSHPWPGLQATGAEDALEGDGGNIFGLSKKWGMYAIVLLWMTWVNIAMVREHACLYTVVIPTDRARLLSHHCLQRIFCSACCEFLSRLPFVNVCGCLQIRVLDRAATTITVCALDDIRHNFAHGAIIS